MSLIASILEEVRKAQTKDVVNKLIFTNDNGFKSNEFLFILKPEVFAKINKEQSKELLEIVFDRFAKRDVCVDNVRVLNASYLNKYSVISQHYGVINAAARNFNAILTQEIRANFHKFYDASVDDVSVLGALELYKSSLEISDEVLADLWSTVDVKRLSGGVYAGKVNYKGHDLYIINGFHPPQLRHFIDKNRVIVTMNLSGDIHWQEARGAVIGNTYPEKAEKGSLRRDLRDKFGKLGFDSVSYLINCVHLSAGPLEGLLELQRFNSELQYKSGSPLENYHFGRMLAAEFTGDLIDEIIANPFVMVDGKEISLFDLTEEMNSQPALELIKKSMR